MSGTTVVPSITFNEIPSPLYVPGSYVEVRPNFTNVGILPFPARNLIVGQMLSSGNATPNAINQNIVQPQQATALFGAGSHAEGMVIAYQQAGNTIPLDVIGISDAAGSAKAVFSLTVGGTWTTAGTTAIGVCGVRLATGTVTSDTPSTTATELAALINANAQLPVVATVAGGVITLTARNAGLAGNDISIISCPAAGDVLPAGMTITITQTTSGATNPSIASAISAITGLWYTGIAMPYQDSTNIALLTAELTRRFTALVKEDARAYICLTGTYSQALSAIEAIDSQFVVTLPMTQPQSPPWAVAASLLAVVEGSLVQDPSLQLAELALPGIAGPVRANLLNETEQQMMLAGNGSTFNCGRDGGVTLSRVVCAYTSNAAGVADGQTYFDVMEVAVASRIRYDWRSYRKLMFPNYKLAPDGSTAAQYNSNVVTPSRMMGAWAARMMVYAQSGWIENEVADARAAVFKIDANDRNRLDYSVQYTRIGNLIVDAGVLEFTAN